mgnify:CR=1 FL=1
MKFIMMRVFAEFQQIVLPISFKQAYEASKIVDEGGYALYKGDWAANNKDAQYTNFVNIFLKDTEENIS